jgi:hypothetical protein
MYTEFILLPEEVHAVTREMREHDQFVTAVHNHELVIHPRFYWFHSFGTGILWILPARRGRRLTTQIASSWHPSDHVAHWRPPRARLVR